MVGEECVPSLKRLGGVVFPLVPRSCTLLAWSETRKTLWLQLWMAVRRRRRRGCRRFVKSSPAASTVRRLQCRRRRRRRGRSDFERRSSTTSCACWRPTSPWTTTPTPRTSNSCRRRPDSANAFSRFATKLTACMKMSWSTAVSAVIRADDVVRWRGYCDHFITMYVGMYVCGCVC